MAEPRGADRHRAGDSRRRAGPMLVLAFAQGDSRTPVRFSPAPGGNLLGRGCTLFPGGPLEDRRLSRSHADLRRRAERWMVEDLGSRNGTRLGGVLIDVDEPTPLEDGDVLRMGGCVFVFRENSVDLPDGGRLDAPIVGRSDAMALVHRSVPALADHDASILISGERGTGKEVVSRAVHEASRRTGAFVAVDCAAFSAAELERELFEGPSAASGTSGDALRGFQAAEGGTLLLDEVGSMPPDLQRRLLRVLEARRTEPRGGRNVPLDVRVVAATSVDLVAAVRKGRFRADLYARLSSHLVRLPPLRERIEDVPLLSRALLVRQGRSDCSLHARFVEALMLQDWPGNVVALDDVLRVAAASNDGPVLRMTDQAQARLRDLSE